ncbi:MAG: hypothetical protein KatS3mg036_1148 [Ignavibacterium sp.]|nr:MAG: hypothetical protein KatS3mg036_1148 [Ignavibacterium sp.]
MSLFKKIINGYKDQKQKKINKEEFYNTILKAVDDGILTEKEIVQLEDMINEFGLKEEEIHNIKILAYYNAYKAIKNDGIITHEEESELKKIQKYLKIEDEAILATKRELFKYRLLNEIAKGNLPKLTVPNLLIQKNEDVHLIESATLIENKIINRRYEGGSRGTSIKIAKGISFRIGSHRGHLVSERAYVPVSDGELIITNKRIIFRGDLKSFSIKLEKLLYLEIDGNFVNLSEVSGKHRFIQISNIENIDLVGAILSSLLNNKI